MGVFDAPVNGLAALLGTSTDVAGFFLGLVLIFALWIAVTWAIGKSTETSLIGVAIGIAVSIGIGWWPGWAAVVIALVIIAILVLLHRPSGGL